MCGTKAPARSVDGSQMSFFKVNEKCNGCLACVQNCPNRALDYRDHAGKRALLHNMGLCARCGQCWRVCPQQAVEFRHLLESPWQEVVALDLIPCRVCGEPVYTPDYGEKVSEKLRMPAEDLCPEHRREKSLSVWSRIRPGSPPSPGGAK
jgi:ferredoxin